mmetsp:Transcript_22766/g.53110  ORF Transcript_22766/g.53110 Transcript_22766/m.53110 type:complete len:532 (-) Transcript_22766:196-1791(-)
MSRISLLFPCLLLLSSVHVGHCNTLSECSSSVAPEGGDIFIQNTVRKGNSLSLEQSGKKFAKLLATEMSDLVATKGKSGLAPEEIEHIHAIKDLIMSSIIPSIVDGVADSRAELEELAEAVAACADHLDDAMDKIVPLATETSTTRDLHKECRQLEDDLIEEKEKACKLLEKAQLGVHAPELDFEIDIDISDQEMLKYLRTMNEHFCGRWEEFKDVWEECDDVTDNYTTTNDKCKGLQEEFEEDFCTWKSELELTCKNFDSCWTEAVGRFNERREAIQTLQDSRTEEYEAAVMVNCLWDAWDWEADPCTVNETKVKECKEDLHPDTTNVTLETPKLPTPPECNIDPVSAHPCTSGFFDEEYATLGVSPALVADIKEACTACPEPSPTLENIDSTLQRSGVSTSLQNLMSAAGSMYVKTGGMPGKCDGVVKGSSATSVKVNVLQASSKVEVELVGDNGSAHKMVLENDMATANGKSILFSADDDTLGISVENGKVQFTKSGVAFTSAPAAFQRGAAKVAICTAGASVKARFA